MFFRAANRKSSERSGSEESDSGTPNMPVGGMHITMGPGGCHVDRAPGLPVDMATSGPLLQAVMMMLAKKERLSYLTKILQVIRIPMLWPQVLRWITSPKQCQRRPGQERGRGD